MVCTDTQDLCLKLTPPTSPPLATTDDNNHPLTQPIIPVKPFGPWMVIEIRRRRNSKPPQSSKNIPTTPVISSHFNLIFNVDEKSYDATVIPHIQTDLLVHIAATTPVNSKSILVASK
ncbi:hypothetical protein V6N13_039566 [Hibiscus sabdariffa]|uniref:Uncharacterized protein n=1 Tax=Hibiscus sabdariffa TaxID=183260 RepID=A0ABR2SVX4_9ROSI